MVLIHEQPQERLFKPLAYIRNMSVLRMALWAGVCGVAGLIVGNSSQLSLSSAKQNQAVAINIPVSTLVPESLTAFEKELLPYLQQLSDLNSIDVGDAHYSITHLKSDSVDRAQTEREILIALRAHLATTATDQYSSDEKLMHTLLLATVENALFSDLAVATSYSLRHYGTPYLMTAYSGAQIGLSEIFLLQQPLFKIEDVNVYLMRFADTERVLMEVTEALEKTFKTGSVPPHRVLSEVIDALKAFRKFPPEKHPYTVQFNRRIDKITDFSTAEKIAASQEVQGRLEKEIYPALIVLENALQSRLSEAPKIGLWRSPQGQKVYTQALLRYAAETPNINTLFLQGQKEVQRLNNERIAANQLIEAMAERVSVSARQRSQQNYFANTPKGRTELLTELRRQGYVMTSKRQHLPAHEAQQQGRIVPLPKTFIQLVESHVYSLRTQAKAARPVSWLNVEDTSQWPLRQVKTRAYNLAMYNRAMQPPHSIDLMEVASQLRHIFYYPAYTEGWALYGEHFAAEMGLYQADPKGNLGRLESELEASALLVADIGLHAKKWSFEEAMTYLMTEGGLSDLRAEQAISRIAALPGAALAPKVGQMKMLSLRHRAENALGKNFDLQQFHKEVLKHGPMPLSVLEAKIERWIQESLTTS